MGLLYRYVYLVVAITISMTACSARSVQNHQTGDDVSKSPLSDLFMQKSVTDKAILDFLAANKCHRLNQFQMCEEIGMTLETNANQVIESVFIYLKNTESFNTYKGELPFNLELDDSRETVESKLRQQRVGTGVPNERGQFDRTHCWATYYSAGMTIIYDSPSADDRAARMHAIVVTR
jgi:hypothetical protein